MSKAITEEMIIRAPRLYPIPLPPNTTAPFYMRASLADPKVLGGVDFGIRSLTDALRTLNSDEGSRPATKPSTGVIRIVHPRLDQPFYILPRRGSNIVTVYDLLSGIHAHLWSEAKSLARLNGIQQQETLIAAQERCQRSNSPKNVRHIDMLDGSTLFMGLVQNISQAHFYVAPGEQGIDGYQAVTWILQTSEPLLQSSPVRYSR